MKSSGGVVADEGKEGMKLFADFYPPNASTIVRKPLYFLVSRSGNGRETLRKLTLANVHQTHARPPSARKNYAKLGHRWLAMSRLGASCGVV